jgi:SAM-dependent methyltransferase
MEVTAISGHYEAVSSQYGLAWWAAPAHTNRVDSLLLHYLKLGPSDRLVDLGSGTGALAAHLRQAAGLEEVTVVDPSPGMLAAAAARPGVLPVCLGAEEWAAEGKEGDCDRVVVKDAVHHFDQARLVETLAGVHRRLAPGGRLVVAKRGGATSGEHLPEAAAAIRDSTLIDRWHRFAYHIYWIEDNGNQSSHLDGWDASLDQTLGRVANNVILATVSRAGPSLRRCCGGPASRTWRATGTRSEWK